MQSVLVVLVVGAQWTDEYCDEHTCYAVMRGGTTYSPQGSRYYFPRPADLREHNAFLSTHKGWSATTWKELRSYYGGFVFVCLFVWEKRSRY